MSDLKRFNFKIVHLLTYMKNYWKHMILTVITGVINQISGVGASVIGAYLVSIVATKRETDKIESLLIMLGVLIIIKVIMSYLEMWYAHVAAYGILAEFRVKIYYALEKIAPSYLLKKRSGEIASTLMSDVEILEWFYAHTVCAYIIALIVPLIILIYSFTIHWMIPLVLMPWLILTGIVPYIMKKKAETLGQETRENMGNLTAEVVDGIQGLKEILTFGFESSYLKKLKISNKILSKSQMEYGKKIGIEDGIISIFTALGMISIMALSAFLISKGKLSHFQYPINIILAIYIFVPIIAVTKTVRNLGMIKSSAERVFSVLEMPVLVKDEGKENISNNIDTYIEFRDVHFKYKEDLKEVLNKVSFRINQGETIALVGHSGAGKSTCANLLMRFWDVRKGSINIGGVDIRKMPIEALRNLISVVPQDVYLFNTTIKENIKMGDINASDEQIQNAAKAAFCHDFISDLPQGYDTIVGERAVQLSGGQKQRIAIARAILKNAPILIMDEAVSNLDVKNEKEIQEAISKLRKGRTTLVIAHRISTILSADRIVVMKEGKVVEDGYHKDLIKNLGEYSRLIDSQKKAI